MQDWNRRRALGAGLVLAAGLASGNARAQQRVARTVEDIPIRAVPRPLPSLTCLDAEGHTRALAELAPHGAVVNLWATWCVPCVAEMPSLATLAQALGPGGPLVMPIASDRGGAGVVRGFFQREGITRLPILLDPEGRIEEVTAVRGIPTTLLVDAAGRERGRIEGSVDWAQPGTAARVRMLLAG